jgi:hypothetical protein
MILLKNTRSSARIILRAIIVYTALSAGCDTLPFAQKTASPEKILEYRLLCGNLQCPQFVLTVFSDGTLQYQGIAFTSLMGRYARKMPESEWQTMKTSIESANIWGSLESHPAPDPNYAITEITVFEGQAMKQVIGQLFPREIQTLEKLLQQYADPIQQDWKLQEEFAYNLPANKYNSMFKVQLQPNINVDYWIAKYYDTAMQQIKTLPEGTNYWLVRFDPSRILPNLLKETLERDTDVLRVEYVDKPRN